MQAIKMAALQEAENTSRRIREQAAWFYLRHMNIDEETKAHAVFNGLLTRKEREMLPTPQGEKEKEVRSQLCTRSALLEAQLYDTINAYTKLFIMNDASLPDDLRKKLNAELEQFNAQTTQMLTDKSADCVRRNASADQMAEELLEVFNKRRKSWPGTSTEPICRRAGIIFCISSLRQDTVNFGMLSNIKLDFAKPV